MPLAKGHTIRYMEWHELLKARLIAKGIKQDRLAEELGVTPGNVGHWLNGRRVPPIHQLIQLVMRADMTLDQLFAKELGIDPSDAEIHDLLGQIDSDRLVVVREMLEGLARVSPEKQD